MLILAKDIFFPLINKNKEIAITIQQKIRIAGPESKVVGGPIYEIRAQPAVTDVNGTTNIIAKNQRFLYPFKNHAHIKIALNNDKKAVIVKVTTTA